jgi:hypothetical protein
MADSGLFGGTFFGFTGAVGAHGAFDALAVGALFFGGGEAFAGGGSTSGVPALFGK